MIELIGSSHTGIEEAVRNAVAKAAIDEKSLRWFERAVQPVDLPHLPSKSMGGQSAPGYRLDAQSDARSVRTRPQEIAMSLWH